MNPKLHIIFALFSVVFSYAQVTIIADTDKKVLNAKEPFILTVIQETNGNHLMQETPLRTPDLSKFHKISEGSVRQTYADPVSKTVINQLVYEFLLEPKQSGKIKIGSFLITVNGVIYKSEPFEIFVKDGDFSSKPNAENTSESVYLNWELEQNEIYTNQPTMAVIKAYSKDFNNLRKIGKVSFSEQNGVEIRPINMQKSKIEQNNETKMASKILGVVMLVSNKSGKIYLPSAYATYKENYKVENLESNVQKINVKKLPEHSPKNFKDAVGTYEIFIVNENNSTYFEVNKPINISVKMVGEGNLKPSQLPKILPSEDFSLYEPEIKSSVSPTNKGQKGEIWAKYILIPRKSGNISIKTEPFSYFNPEIKEYKNIKSKTLIINALTTKEIAAAKSTMEKVNEYTNTVLETVNKPIIETDEFKIKNKTNNSWYKLVINYLLIALSLLFSVVLILRFRKIKSKKIKKCNAPIGSVAETEAEIRERFSIDADTEIKYMKKMIETGNYAEFFNTFLALNKTIEQYTLNKKNKKLKLFLEENNGAKIAEDYQKLLQQMEMEKYAPHHTKEHLEELLSETEKIFLNIL